MIEWIIWGVFILLVALFVKVEHDARKIKVVVLIIIVILFYFSISSVFHSKTLDLTSPRGIINAVYIYVGWIGETASKLWDVGTGTTKAVGHAIKFNYTQPGD